MKYSTTRLLSWLLLTAIVLSGCAGPYLLDNNVQSLSGLTAIPAHATYRFERLPLLQAPVQGQLESMADAALQKAGLRRDDANPAYTVEVGAGLQPVLSPWASPVDVGGWGGFHGSSRLMPFMDSPWYQREMTVVLRELPSHRVVFESRVVNEGPWLDMGSVFPAMFEAALQGFPSPPPGPRRVSVKLGS